MALSPLLPEDNPPSAAGVSHCRTLRLPNGIVNYREQRRGLTLRDAPSALLRVRNTFCVHSASSWGGCEAPVSAREARQRRGGPAASLSWLACRITIQRRPC